MRPRHLSVALTIGLVIIMEYVVFTTLMDNGDPPIAGLVTFLPLLVLTYMAVSIVTFRR